MIQTRNLTKKFGNFTAVDSLELNIRSGEIYGFLGPNGAGKTTTILMLLGILRPTSGDIYLFGEKFSSRRLDLKQKLGVVPEKHPAGMWKWMTAGEYLVFFADLYGIKKSDIRIKHLLQKVDLLEVKNKRMKDFSRGMLQKLSIVRALLPDPDILFLDEPIAGLDPIGIKQVRDFILSENREGRTVFISSHLLSEMEKICHRVAIISDGTLRAEETMDTLLSKFSREKEVQVDLEEIPDNLCSKLKELDFIIDASRQANTLVLKIPPDRDYRKDISRFLIQRELIPLRLYEKSISLEEVFTMITGQDTEKPIDSPENNIETSINSGEKNEL